MNNLSATAMDAKTSCVEGKINAHQLPNLLEVPIVALNHVGVIAVFFFTIAGK